MRRLVSFLMYLTLALVPPRATFADDEEDGARTPAPAGENSMVAEPEEVNKSLTFTYFGVYQGPSITNPLDVGVINPDTATFDHSAHQNLNNQFKLDFN